jgi:hypothetical protein
MKATPLSKDAKEAQALIDSVKNIRDVYPEVSSEDVKRMLEKWTGSLQKESDTDAGKDEEKYATNSSEKADRKGGRTIDEAFGDMVDA